MGKKKKLLLNVILFVIVIELIVVLAVILLNKTNIPGINKQVNVGNKHLKEMEYDQAKATFEAVIEIEPNNKEANLGLAESAYYIALNSGKSSDYHEALDVVDTALEVYGPNETNKNVSGIYEALNAVSGTVNDDNQSSNGLQTVYNAIGMVSGANDDKSKLKAMEAMCEAKLDNLSYAGDLISEALAETPDNEFVSESYLEIMLMTIEAKVDASEYEEAMALISQIREMYSDLRIDKLEEEISLKLN